MKVVSHDPDNWVKDHPTGLIGFQHMLKGEPNSPDNFMYILANQEGDFLMPVHRHNFDQIRLPISGDMNLGKGLVLKEGQIGYFPEGLSYGPQEDLGKRLQLVLQFGGASGYGFMTIEQRRQAMKELSEFGSFEGPYYRRPDGRREWGLNPVWEQVFGVRLKYPRPRYQHVIIADPKRFNWLPVDHAKNLEHKYMGAFSERGVWIEMFRTGTNADWTSTDPRARRLFFILSGEGTANNEPLTTFSAVQVDAGETLNLTASGDMEIFLIGLPPVTVPPVESTEFDWEERPEEAAQA